MGGSGTLKQKRPPRKDPFKQTVEEYVQERFPETAQSFVDWAKENYVGIDHDGGHFAGPEAMLQQRAEDAALLDSAVQGPKGQTRKSDA